MTKAGAGVAEGRASARKRRVTLPAALWRLVAVQTLMNGSHFMAMPLLAVFCSEVLKLPVAAVGSVLAVYFIAARVMPVVVAPLVDRFGLWPAVTTGLMLRGAGFLGLYLAAGQRDAVLMAAALGLGTAIYEAGAYGVIGAQAQAERERLIVTNAQGLNLGCVFGPLAGAGLAMIDIALPLLLSGLLFLALACGTMLERAEVLRAHRPQAVRDSLGSVLGDKPFLVLCLALVPWWALFAQLFAAFPIEATARGGSASWAGSVLVVNGAIGFLVLFVVPALIRYLGTLGLLFAAAAVGGLAIASVGFTPGLWPLLVLVGLFSAAEIAILAAAEILVGRHAGGRAVATFFAVFNMSWGVGGAIGGAVGPWIASMPTSGAAWAALGASALLTLAGFALYLWMRPVALEDG